MKEPYDPKKAPLGPIGGRQTYRSKIIAHNRKVLARRLEKSKRTASVSSS
jgi:hypothetical protein